MPLFLLFVVLPVAELWLLIHIGGAIGLWRTVVLVLVMGVVGTILVRLEGVRTLRRAQENMANGIPPAEEVVDGLVLLVAGVLFITPGVLTDGMALLLLFPPTRRLFKIWLRHRFDRAIARGQVRVWRGPGD